MAFLPIFLSCLLLSILSITNLALISSMVAWLHIQKTQVKSYAINWPNDSFHLQALPEHLWLDQGHTSNGVAGYGFFLGLVGLYVAWRQRKRDGRGPSKTLLGLVILLSLAVVFTLVALAFVFTVAHDTKGQTILSSVAKAGVKYPAHKWTPATWYKAVLKLPLADGSVRSDIKSHVTNIEAWEYMLIPIFLTDILALGIAVTAMMKQRKGQPSENPTEK
ncbi:uncharacterized protein BDZ99DRAFT_468347 [Mytilinidion resinicola]|uniref:Uncharacterized protein n=1 Tax=Mytilinidion resinicola TaxID=574789 RepID=A0A6A6Y3J3_9PEZI|nr:uncharacterized protein BDZ99DRAFT_468347 [Mytilinidion resinicola]KAF2803396.1 hypothetical protein BDZ99DRAFT_468347 [Mytilinidion resinicola]